MHANLTLVPIREKYMLFTLDTDQDLAERTFTSRFGYHPDKVVEEQGHVWVGPIKDRE